MFQKRFKNQKARQKVLSTYLSQSNRHIKFYQVDNCYFTCKNLEQISKYAQF